MDPGGRAVIVGDLDAGTLAGQPRRGVAGVAVEEQFRILMQVEKADRAVETRYGLGSHPNLGALERTKNGEAPSGVVGSPGHLRDRRAARVVAVIAHAGADKKFGLGERPEHHAEFRAADGAL